MRQLERLYDRLESERGHRAMKRLAVVAALVGLMVHLLIVALIRGFPSLAVGPLTRVDPNFLHAIYTPFSFILFYEVLMLVLALPKSHTQSIGMQYQIISLITLRRVFKDVGELSNLETWSSQTEASMHVLYDMAGALGMFLLVLGFYWLRKSFERMPPLHDLDRFIRLKKSVAVLLGLLLVGLASYNLVIWLASLMEWQPLAAASPQDVDRFFFPAFFEFMIFTDVFLLILSIQYYERYEYVFRNAGFVVSTILLRISLSTAQPEDVAIALVAMAYGLLVLAVFVMFSKGLGRDRSITDPQEPSEEALRVGG